MHEILEALDEAETDPNRGADPSRRSGILLSVLATPWSVMRCTQACPSASAPACIWRSARCSKPSPMRPVTPASAQLAHHFVQAAPLCPLERVLGHVLRAAERAAQTVAYEEAARLYALALRLVEDGSLDQPEARCDLLLLARAPCSRGWAMTLHRTRRFAAAACAGTPAWVTDRRGPGGPPARPGGTEATLCAARQEYRSPDARGVGLLVEALAAVGEGDSAGRVRLLARIGARRRPGRRPSRP